jgi:hypothetical protein
MWITRRAMVAGLGVAAFAQTPLVVPVRRILDKRVPLSPDPIWPEAVRDFARGGIELRVTDVPGEVGRAASGRPVFKGLAHGVINLVVTDYVPLEWDQAKGLAGLTTQYDGYHVCLIAMRHAHGNQVPFFSVNTYVHELLHVLLHDIFETRPKGADGSQREWRIDRYATWLWLFGDGAEIRRMAAEYLRRSGAAAGLGNGAQPGLEIRL